MANRRQAHVNIRRIGLRGDGAGGHPTGATLIFDVDLLGEVRPPVSELPSSCFMRLLRDAAAVFKMFGKPVARIFPLPR